MNVIVFGGSLAATLPILKREVAKSPEEFIKLMRDKEDAFGFLFARSAIEANLITHAIRSGGSHAPLVVLMKEPNHTDIASCLNAGADQVERVDLTFGEVQAYLTAIPRRGAAITPSTVRFGNFIYQRHNKVLKFDGKRLDFGPTAMAMLHAIINSNEPLTWLDLVSVLEKDMQRKTVDVHICGLRRRMRELTGDVDYIVTHHRVGYRFVHEGVPVRRSQSGRMVHVHRFMAAAE